MSRLEASAKAYRIIFPASMQEQELQRLQHWADRNCYKSAVSRTPAAVSWVAIRERTRTAGAFRRHVRDVLDACAVACRPQGRWLTLLSNEEAEALIQGPKAHESQHEPVNAVCSVAHDSDDKVVVLGSPLKPAFGPSSDVTTPTSFDTTRGGQRARSAYRFEIVRE